MSLFSNHLQQKKEERRAAIYSALLHHEAKAGGELFGDIPKGHRREFFCLDQHTWVWHEEWKDEAGQWQAVTTRYDVRPGGILKSQGGDAYKQLSGLELANFYRAVKIYDKQIGGEYGQLLQAA
ncbi:MAG TPA: hypothetical protein VF572_02990 [Candidatus Saccharimonadales bacterium]|jgi:hypothetical protein